MKTDPVYIVDVMKQVVEATDTKLFPTMQHHIHYEPGRSIQILQKLQQLNSSVTLKGKKYPLFALFLDIEENFGANGYYCDAKFPKISIATLTDKEDDVMTRYQKNFKPILYPVFFEFLRQLARHKNVVGNDPGAFIFKKWDRPNTLPAADKTLSSTFNDYLDSIDIAGLQVTFKQVQPCKTI